jgi:5-methylcytosine-specific restriction endonuclease McrA
MRPSQRTLKREESATDIFQSDAEFVERLRSLKERRLDRKMGLRDRVPRESLSSIEREAITAKTEHCCHMCGGKIEGDAWEADHVFSHALGGGHSVDNYLPAHTLCNGYRWFYLSEEFQWILKLGVWLRTHIEKQTAVGRIAVKAFCAHERARLSRRKTNKTPN